MVEQHVYLAPCSHKRPQSHLQATVLNGISASVYREYTTKDFGETVGIWGLTPGLQTIWERIERDDYLLFYLGNEHYRYATRVLGKERNQELALGLWPDYASKAAGGGDTTDPWEFILYLDDPIEIDLDSSHLHGWAGHAINHPKGFMPLNPDGLAAIQRRYGSIDQFIQEYRLGVSSNDNLSEPEQRPVDIGPPKRTTAETSRILRNTIPTTALKELYEYSCQVCGEKRWRTLDQPYAEGHHLKPLGRPHDGPDISGNILVLCPNHHADFDYGMIDVDPTTFEINHAYDDEIDGMKLAIHEEHNLFPEFVEYHSNQLSQI